MGRSTWAWKGKERNHYSTHRLYEGGLGASVCERERIFLPSLHPGQCAEERGGSQLQGTGVNHGNGAVKILPSRTSPTFRREACHRGDLWLFMRQGQFFWQLLPCTGHSRYHHRHLPRGREKVSQRRQDPQQQSCHLWDLTGVCR